MVALVAVLLVLVVAGLIAAGRSFRVVQQYEQGIIFRFGKTLPGTRGPGLTWIRPFGDRMQKVNMQIIAMAVPAQEGITRDNVSVRVDAVVYFRVVDPIKATINVQNYLYAISQQAQTSLRSIIGQSEMDQLLAERDTVNRELRQIIDEPTETACLRVEQLPRPRLRRDDTVTEALDVPVQRRDRCPQLVRDVAQELMPAPLRRLERFRHLVERRSKRAELVVRCHGNPLTVRALGDAARCRRERADRPDDPSSDQPADRRRGCTRRTDGYCQRDQQRIAERAVEMAHHRVRDDAERFANVVVEDRRRDLERDGNKSGAAREDDEQLSSEQLAAEAAAERRRSHPVPMR